jgi:hypothetical protein
MREGSCAGTRNSVTNNYSPLEERFNARWLGEPNSGCWLWMGAATFTGHSWRPVIVSNGAHKTAHRVSYELHVGPIPHGMFVCHKCDTPLCVRPDHLYLGTRADNTADMVSRSRQMFGERHCDAKLSDAEIREIRAATCTDRELAKHYGVSDTTIARARARKTWRHVH